jgi:hypothetical protein
MAPVRRPAETDAAQRSGSMAKQVKQEPLL